MRLITISLTCLCSLFLAVTTTSAKAWRGVTPLHSTRDQVKRLLGKPKSESPYAFYYRFSDAIAVVHFQWRPCKESCGLGWDVEVGTVTNIGVVPRLKNKKAESVLDSNFKIEKTGGGFVYYTNEEAGISVEKYNGIITLVTYSPTLKDSKSRCPPTQDCIIDSFPKFDEYAKLSFQDEKARLDNYVIQIRAMMGRGAIVVYGKTREARRELMKSAARSRNYLVKERKLERERLLIVNGGYKELSLTELHLYDIGAEFSRVWLSAESLRITKTLVVSQGNIRLYLERFACRDEDGKQRHSDKN